jgi:hypothetical protein
MYFSRFAADLAELGHVTQLVVPSNARPPDFVAANRTHRGFTYTTYPVDGEIPFANSPETSEAFLRLALSRSVVQRFQIMSSFAERLNVEVESDCIRLLDNDELMSRIRSSGFQFAVMDPFVIHCYYTLPYSLGIPYATLSVPNCPWFYRVPRLPSFASSSLGYSDRMSFVERLSTLAYDVAILTLVNSSIYFVEKYAADKPPLTALQLVKQMSA